MMAEPIALRLPPRLNGEQVVAHASSAEGMPEHDLVAVCVSRDCIFTVWHAYVGANAEWHIEEPRRTASYVMALHLMLERAFRCG